MTFQGYEYYAHRTIDLALRDTDVDSTSSQEMKNYAEDIADQLCLDPDKLSSKVHAYTLLNADIPELEDSETVLSNSEIKIVVE